MTKEIKKLLIDQEISITELSRRIGISRTWVSLVINGHMKATETRKLIAAALGRKMQELWPNDNNGDKKRAA